MVSNVTNCERGSSTHVSVVDAPACENRTKNSSIHLSSELDHIRSSKIPVRKWDNAIFGLPDAVVFRQSGKNHCGLTYYAFPKVFTRGERVAM